MSVTLLGELTDRLVAYTGCHYSEVSAENTLFEVWMENYSKSIFCTSILYGTNLSG